MNAIDRELWQVMANERKELRARVATLVRANEELAGAAREMVRCVAEEANAANSISGDMGARLSELRAALAAHQSALAEARREAVNEAHVLATLRK